MELHIETETRYARRYPDGTYYWWTGQRDGKTASLRMAAKWDRRDDVAYYSGPLDDGSTVVKIVTTHEETDAPDPPETGLVECPLCTSLVTIQVELPYGGRHECPGCCTVLVD